MAQQSARRGRKNQMYSSCLEHAFMIWFRSANSHTGPQLDRCIRGRTDGSIRLRADILQKPLASRGASTDGLKDDDKYHVVANNRTDPVFLKYANEHPLTPERGSLVGRTALERKTVHMPDCLADPEYVALEYQRVGHYRSMLGFRC